MVTWKDIERAFDFLKQHKVPGPYWLRVENPHLLQKFKKYQRYRRRYERHKTKPLHS